MPLCTPQAAWHDAHAPWPAGVRAGCTLRSGGCSGHPWDTFNLGDHVGDHPEAVRRNRALLGQSLGLQLPFMQQVHGTHVQQLQAGAVAGACADACWTEVPRTAAVVLVADCLPVLLSSADGSSVAAVHAGWRGLVGQGGVGVFEALCAQWPALASRHERREVCVWLGPCIGPTAFEVGTEVLDAYTAADPEAARCFTPVVRRCGTDGYLADLAGLARQRLARLGLTRVHGNDGSLPWCTYSQPSRFFSHRRDAARFGASGRMAALIWRSGV